MPLIICHNCGKHHFNHETDCPHCDNGLNSNVGVGKRAAMTLLLGLSLGCGDKSEPEPDIQALYGEAAVDMDEDGFDYLNDCDDEDPEVNPDAEEIPGDGVDSNCDGEDDT